MCMCMSERTETFLHKIKTFSRIYTEWHKNMTEHLKPIYRRTKIDLNKEEPRAFLGLSSEVSSPKDKGCQEAEPGVGWFRAGWNQVWFRAGWNQVWGISKATSPGTLQGPSSEGAAKDQIPPSTLGLTNDMLLLLFWMSFPTCPSRDSHQTVTNSLAQSHTSTDPDTDLQYAVITVRKLNIY